MPDLLVTLDRRWEAFAASHRGHRTLQRWQATEPALAGIHDLGELTDAARDLDSTDLDGRDELHLALLRLAATDDDARCAVLHLLFPALAITARLYSDTWDHDEAVSILVTATLTRIIRYPHGVPRPAATILRYVRNIMWKEAQRHNRDRRLLADITVLDDALDIPTRVEPCAGDELLALVNRAVQDGALDAAQAQLVIDHRLFNVPTADIAETAGYPASTIRQRRSRAEAALAYMATGQVA